MLTEDELVETMEKERHRTLKVWRDAVSLAEGDTQLIIAERLGYGAYTKRLKAAIMSLTMGVRAYGSTLSSH